jgi:hypothetical protein
MTEYRQTSPESQSPDIEIDFFGLIRYALEAWKFILVSVVLSVSMTMCGLRNVPPTYEANMVLAPAPSSDPSASQSLTSKLLGSFGGSGGAGGPLFDQFQYKMTSPSVVHAANVDGKLYEWIYPGLWDARTRGWIKPRGARQFITGIVRAFFHKPDWIPPDDVMTSDYLKKQINFEVIPKSTLTNVSYQNSDPSIATAMLQRLFDEADRQLRNAQRARLKAQIANANVMLATTQVTDFRQAMAQALGGAQYQLMTVPDNIDYSANNVERPYVSSLPVAPKLGLSLMMAIAGTFLLSTFFAIAYRIVAAELNRRNTTILNGAELTLRNIFLFAAQKYRGAKDGMKR